jgi:hypothetical protein
MDDNEWKAYLNDIEIPIEDCLDNGMLRAPEYMQEGDVVSFRSPYIKVSETHEIKAIHPLSETIH